MLSNEIGPTEGKPKDGVEETASTKAAHLEFAEVLRGAINSTESNENSSEEFTEKDLQELKVALEKELPKEKVDPIINVFAKFTKGSEPEKQLEGFVCEFYKISSLYLFINLFQFS